MTSLMLVKCMAVPTASAHLETSHVTSSQHTRTRP
ncbi:hypothetical protein GQ607_008892 [Colletotrichum asianum]|uniref:Uncharacterized protein n=1 Tax=Colletotrichum asianum TaxID=702518 RepID=A0A8H3ZUF4_9PEZI|nr:hypothetical protein GQ607_008892 [Colletotrichum asianum]